MSDQKTDYTPRYSITTDEYRREVRFSVEGFWDDATVKSYLKELGEAVIPFQRKNQTFRAMGDLTRLMAQSRKTADALGRALATGKQVGMERIAIVTTSPIMKLQYRRVAGDVELEFFDTTAQAREWLAVKAKQRA